MNKPIGKKIRYFFEFLAVYLMLGIVRMLPISVASRLGGGLLRLLGPMTPSHKVALRNLKRAFPGQDVRALSRRVWANVGQVMFEYPRLSELFENNAIEFEGIDRLHRAVESGVGGILVSGHLGNWECIPSLAEKSGIPMSAMYRAPNNAWVGKLLARCRNLKAVRYIPKSASGTKEIFSSLSSGGFVGVLVDLRSNRGLHVDFLGGPALIAPTVALMAWRYKCPIIPIRSERLATARYRITVHEPIPVDRTLSADAFVDDTVGKVMSTLESWIRDNPEQWFWMQNLWLKED